MSIPLTRAKGRRSSFAHVFGDAPHARVFDYLLQSEAPDHTITEISRGADVARPTAYKVVDDMIAGRLLRETRLVGNSRFYALDPRSRAVRELARVAPILGGGRAR